MAIFPQLSTKGQGQRHRNKKLAKNVLFFLILKVMCPQFIVILFLYLVFIDITTMPF